MILFLKLFRGTTITTEGIIVSMTMIAGVLTKDLQIRDQHQEEMVAIIGPLNEEAIMNTDLLEEVVAVTVVLLRLEVAIGITGHLPEMAITVLREAMIPEKRTADHVQELTDLLTGHRVDLEASMKGDFIFKNEHLATIRLCPSPLTDAVSVLLIKFLHSFLKAT